MKNYVNYYSLDGKVVNATEFNHDLFQTSRTLAVAAALDVLAESGRHEYSHTSIINTDHPDLPVEIVNLSQAIRMTECELGFPSYGACQCGHHTVRKDGNGYSVLVGE